MKIVNNSCIVIEFQLNAKYMRRIEYEHDLILGSNLNSTTNSALRIEFQLAYITIRSYLIRFRFFDSHSLSLSIDICMQYISIYVFLYVCVYTCTHIHTYNIYTCISKPSSCPVSLRPSYLQLKAQIFFKRQPLMTLWFLNNRVI